MQNVLKFTKSGALLSMCVMISDDDVADLSDVIPAQDDGYCLILPVQPVLISSDPSYHLKVQATVCFDSLSYQ